MNRLLYPMAAVVLCILMAITTSTASVYSTPCIDEWEEGAYPPREMAMLAVSCPDNVLISLPASSCEVLVDIPEPTSNCTIVSITNDFNGMAEIVEQTFGPTNIMITWTITDCDGTFTCTQFVLITDDTAPTLVCPPSDSQQCTADDMIPFTSIQELVDAGAIVEDNCQLDSSFLLVGDLVLEDAGPCPAVYSRAYTVRDTSDNETTCMQTILVEDTMAPIFTCPANLTVNTDIGACSAMVIIPVPDIIDNCGIDTMYNSLTGDDLIATLTLGDTDVTYYAVDSCGNIDSCVTVLTVIDQVAPVLTCPPTLGASCDISEQPPYGDFMTFEADGGSAADNCGIDPSTFELVDEIADGTSCPITVTRRYRVADTSGNYDTCSQYIVIEEMEAPTFDVPADITLNCGADVDDLTITGSPGNIMDNCGANNVAVSYTDMNQTTACPIVTSIVRSWVAIDSCGNESVTMTQNISLQDVMPPVAVCKMDTIYLDESGDAISDPEDLDGGSTDDCGNLTFTSDFTFASCNDVNLTMDIILTVTDDCGNSATCETTILVLDTLPVILNCPADISVDCPTDIPPPYALFTDFMDDGGSFEDNCESDQPQDFYLSTEVQIGTTCPYNILRTYVAQDNNGNVDSCMHTITVDDSMAPIAMCPSDTIIMTMTDVCDTMITLPLITATDACGIASIVNDYTGGGADASGIYPGGMTLVTATVTDNCGNTSTCSFTVTVQADPAFECVSDTTVQCDIEAYPAYTSFQAFMDDGGDANLGCDIDTSTFILDNEILISADMCSEIYTRTYTVSGSMETYTCTQTITVSDDELPTITCDDNLFVNADVDQCYATVTLPVPASSDNCGDPTVTNDYSALPTVQIAVGSTIVVYTATDDCGNTATCSIEILVSDAQAPEITCPDPVTAMCDSDMIPVYNTLLEFIDAGGSVSDNCEIDSSSFTFEGEMEMIIFGMNFVNREYSIQDTVGNQTACTQTILVLDSTEPFVNCPDDVTVQAETGLCEATLTGLIADLGDNCLVDTIYNDFNGAGADASGTFPVGETTVTFTVEDEEGNSSTCNFTVTVEDNIAPLMTCPPDQMTECSIDDVPPYADFDAFTMAGGSAFDICGLDVSSFGLESENTSGSDPVIVTRVYSISDVNGNESMCTQMITIDDNTPPSVTCPNDITVDADANTCMGEVVGAVAIVSDACGVASMTNDYNANGTSFDDLYPIGTTLVTLTVTDASGNIATCTTSITVNDVTEPIVNCPLSLSAQCSISEVPPYDFYLQFEAAGGSAMDCEIDTSTFTLMSETMTGSDPDEFTRIYTVADASGNVGECNQIITVMDTNPPAITCPADVSINNIPGSCSATVTNLIATANDNCGVASITNDYNNNGADASDTYPVGETTVTFTVTDLMGMSSTCTVLVSISDNEDPTLTCPADLTGECTIAEVPPYASYLAFEMDGGSSDDICAVDTSTFMLISETTTGTCPTIVTRVYQIADFYDNTATCTQMISLLDVTDPVITCPDDIAQPNDAGECSAMVNLVLTNIMDNCGVETIANNYTANGADASGIYPVGTTTVTFTVTDSCGGSSTCDVDVTVDDEEDPVIMFNNDVSTPDTVVVMCALAEADTLMSVAELIAAGGSVTDNCLVDDPSFTFLEDALQMGSDPVTYNRLYEIADNSGNLDTLVQVIIVEDTEPPIVTAPDDITIGCGESADVFITGEPTSSDNCTASPLPYTFDDMIEVLGCPNDTLITRTFTVTDDMGNTASAVQFITKLDTVAPVFDPNPEVADTPPMPEDTIACNEDFPVPLMLSATDACGEVTITVDTLDFIADVCTGYQVNYRYIAADACLNRDTVFSSFWVARDTVAPVVIEIDTIVELTIDDNSCEALATLPIPIVSDNCSEFVIANSIDGEDTLTASFPIDTTTFSYTITDNCGNITVVDQMVVVTDDQSPNLTCRTTPIQVAISTDESIVLAASFVLDASDNCGDVDVQVRKLIDLCGITDNSTLGDSLIFCCEEVGSIQEVEVVAVDSSGNETSCIALAEVVDNLKPSLLIPVPDITVSCDFPLDLEDLSGFGTFVLNGDPRSDIIVNDTVYASSDFVAGQDGVYNDNCPDSTTIETTVIDMTTNSVGDISRIFTITDGSGNATTYTQTITVVNLDPFSEEDIIWPEDITIDGCASDIPTPLEGGIPTFTNVNKCSNIQYTHHDLVFDSPTSGCVYVRRTFKVIDAFVYDPSDDPDEGIWTMIQDIYMTNSVAPVFDEGVCSDTLICAQGSGCSALVEIEASATDDCSDLDDLTYSYTIDVDADGTIDISGSGPSISQMLEQGSHLITWTVEDGCNNFESCTKEVEVKECKLPTPICLAVAIDLAPDDGMATIWASDFDAGSYDNCTDAEDLIFSFSPDINEFGRTYTCDSIGIRTVEMWVTDEAGNQDFCVTTVDVQDNTNYCGNDLGENEEIVVMGTVTTQSSSPLSNATVILDGPEIEEEIITNDQGGYVFQGLPMYNDYLITPHKDDEHLAGVSTLDLVLIQRHILGLDSLNSPYNIIAADVNGNEKVSLTDVVELRKLILGVRTDFSNNESFRFVASDYEFVDAQDPFPWMEEKELDKVEDEMVQSDFIAVKIGDVNGSIEDGWNSGQVTETRSSKSMDIWTDDQYFRKDDVILIPLYTNETSIIGLQFTLDYNEDYVEYVSVEANVIPLGPDQIANHDLNGMITVAWSSVDAVYHDHTSDPLVYLAFKAKRDGHLSDVMSMGSGITEAIMYDGSETKHDVILRFESKGSPGFAVMQNRPNPFTEYTEILFELPKASEVSLHVYDNSGKLVYRMTELYASGKHQVRLNRDQLKYAGVYYYKLKAGKHSEVHKMLKIQ